MPAAVAAIPLLIGCVTGALAFDDAAGPLALCLAMAAVLACVAAIGWLADGMAAGVAVAVAAGCLLAGTSLGVTSARGAYHPTLLAWFDAQGETGEPVVLEGVLREDAALTDFGASLVLDAIRIGRAGDGRRTLGGVRLAVGGTSAPAFLDAWRAGRTVRVAASLRLPTTYRNPGLPDERRALARRGVALVGSVKSAVLVEVTAPGHGVSEAAAAARAWSRRTLARYVGTRSARSGAVVTAILIGDRSALDAADERRLQEAGTYHVIAISGGNIAILTVLLLVAFRGLRLRPRLGAAATMVVLVFYAQLAGAPPSVSRAVTAAVVYLAGRMLDHRGPPLNTLAVAAAGALAVSPLAALDPGFILSFGATFAIMAGIARFRSGAGVTTARRRPGAKWTIVRTGWRRLRAEASTLLAATICAELALAPAGAAMFSRVTVAGLLLNFAAIPLMTLAQVAGLATLLLALAGLPAAGAGAVAHGAAWGLVESARLVDVAPWLARDVSPPAWWVLVLYYGGAAALFAGRPRAALLGMGGAAAVMLAGPAAAIRDAWPAPRGLMRVVFLDVGQGDATLVTLPGGRALLVDAGGVPNSGFDIGRRVVVPSLRALGVRRLDELVITHGDPDHLGGALSVAERLAPRVIREGAPVPPHAGLQALAGYAADAGAVWRTVQRGDLDRVAGVDIRVWHPPPPDWERQRVRNDDSIVLELRFRDVSVLLTGDIGRLPELDIAPALSLAPVVVLKAPHHGSATSSSQPFVDAVRPDAVVFSAGRGNHFGHPAPAVVARYAAAHARMFSTAADGAVIVETDGRDVVVRTVSGRVSWIAGAGARPAAGPARAP